jgi:hypothetical protein
LSRLERNAPGPWARNKNPYLKKTTYYYEVTLSTAEADYEAAAEKVHKVSITGSLMGRLKVLETDGSARGQ